MKIWCVIPWNTPMPYTDVGYSQDGQFYASSSDDGFVKIWQTGGAGPGRVLGAIPGQKVMKHDFSPDGKLLVAGSWNAAGLAEGPGLRIWRVADGQLLHDLKGHRAMIYTLAFSPDQKYIAAADFVSSKPQLKLWDPVSGRELRSLGGHSNSIVALAFSGDGRRMISSALDKKVKIWDPHRGVELHSLDAEIALATLAVSPDDRTVVGGSYDGNLEVRRLTDGKLLHRIQAHQRFIVDLAFSSDGRYLVDGQHRSDLKGLEDGTGGARNYR